MPDKTHSLNNYAMIRYFLLLISSLSYFHASSQNIAVPLEGENAKPVVESILDMDLHWAHANSTILYQPRKQMDFSYVRFAQEWPSLDAPEGASSIGYSRAHFRSSGYLSLEGFSVESVLNLDFKSISKGAPLFHRHSFVINGQNVQPYDSKRKRFYFTTSFSQ